MTTIGIYFTGLFLFQTKHNLVFQDNWLPEDENRVHWSGARGTLCTTTTRLLIAPFQLSRRSMLGFAQSTRRSSTPMYTISLRGCGRFCAQSVSVSMSRLSLLRALILDIVIPSVYGCFVFALFQCSFLTLPVAVCASLQLVLSDGCVSTTFFFPGFLSHRLGVCVFIMNSFCSLLYGVLLC